MADKTYRYSGPVSGFTLRGGRDVKLVDGAAVTLDDAHPHTRRLVARGHLVLEQLEQSAPPSSAPASVLVLDDAPPPSGAPQSKTPTSDASEGNETKRRPMAPRATRGPDSDA